MVFANSMFRGLGLDDEKARKLKEAADAAARGDRVEIAPPVVQQPMDIQQRPMEEMPQDPRITPSAIGQLGDIGKASAAGQRYQDPFTPQQRASVVQAETYSPIQQPAQVGDGTGRTMFPSMQQGLPGGTPAVGETQPPGMDDMRRRQEEAARLQNEPASAKTLREINKPYEDPHKHSLLGRLFKGFGKAWLEATPENGGLFHAIGGGIRSAANPGYYAELENRDRQNPLFRRLGMEREQEAFTAKQKLTETQTQNYLDDNKVQQQKADDAARKADRQYEIQRATLDFKIEDRAEYYELEKVKQAARERRDAQTYEIADRRQQELERNNRERIRVSDDRNRVSAENTDRRIDSMSGMKGRVKIPPRSSSTGQPPPAASGGAYTDDQIRAAARARGWGANDPRLIEALKANRAKKK